MDPELAGALLLDKALDILVLILALVVGGLMLHLLLRHMVRSMERAIAGQVLLLRTAIEHSAERHKDEMEAVSSRVASLATQVAGHEVRLVRLEGH